MAIPSNTKRITTSLFDLATFETVKLGLDMPLPKKPESVEEALALVGNDKATLLSVIYDGLVERAVDAAKSDPTNFFTFNEDGELTANAFSGQPVDEDKEKSIQLAVLNLAKAAGYDKSLPADKKRELKQNAMNLIKSNPAMLAFITGQVATQTQGA